MSRPRRISPRFSAADHARLTAAAAAAGMTATAWLHRAALRYLDALPERPGCPAPRRSKRPEGARPSPLASGEAAGATRIARRFSMQPCK